MDKHITHALDAIDIAAATGAGCSLTDEQVRALAQHVAESGITERDKTQKTLAIWSHAARRFWHGRWVARSAEAHMRKVLTDIADVLDGFMRWREPGAKMHEHVRAIAQAAMTAEAERDALEAERDELVRTRDAMRAALVAATEDRDEKAEQHRVARKRQYALIRIAKQHRDNENFWRGGLRKVVAELEQYPLFAGGQTYEIVDAVQTMVQRATALDATREQLHAALKDRDMYAAQCKALEDAAPSEYERLATGYWRGRNYVCTCGSTIYDPRSTQGKMWRCNSCGTVYQDVNEG